MNSGLWLWADTILGRIRVCQALTDIALKNCDPRNWLSVDAVPDVCSEPRLDPLEFHGQRRSTRRLEEPTRQTSRAPAGRNAFSDACDRDSYRASTTNQESKS